LHSGEQLAVDWFLTGKIDWQNGDGGDEREKEAEAYSAPHCFHLDSYLPIAPRSGRIVVPGLRYHNLIHTLG
jgi:hypothetical protein